MGGAATQAAPGRRRGSPKGRGGMSCANPSAPGRTARPSACGEVNSCAQGSPVLLAVRHGGAWMTISSPRSKMTTV